MLEKILLCSSFLNDKYKINPTYRKIVPGVRNKKTRLGDWKESTAKWITTENVPRMIPRKIKVIRLAVVNSPVEGMLNSVVLVSNTSALLFAANKTKTKTKTEEYIPTNLCVLGRQARGDLWVECLERRTGQMLDKKAL